MNSFGVRSRGAPLAAATLAILILIGGCGGSDKPTTTASARPLPPASVRATDGVPIPRPPRRIVSLSPSATEDLFAVGAGKQVVAADENSTYPRSAPRTGLSGFAPNVESIARYRPDLVVIDTDTNHIVAQLGKLHIPLLVDGPPANLDGAYAQIAELGAATGHAQLAAHVIREMRDRVAAILRADPRPRRPPTVYHELDQTYFSASSRSFIGQLYTLLGLRNIADEAPKLTAYPQLSSEYIVASDPSLIVLADTVCCGQTAATLARRPGWNNIAAVKDHAVLAVNDSIASQWGPRIVVFLQDIANEARKLEARQ